MFCNKCGNNLNEDAVFCNKCGNKIKDEENLCSASVENNDTVGSSTGATDTLICQKCGSRNLTVVIKSKVSGGNSASDACCGYAFLGPLGLLCGLHQTKVANQTFWVCQNCGDQFRDRKETLSELFNYAIAFIIVGVIMLYIEISASFWEPLYIFGIILISVGIGLIALWNKARK